MTLTREQQDIIRANESILRLCYGDIKRIKGNYQYKVKSDEGSGIIEIYPEVREIMQIKYEKITEIFNNYIGYETCTIVNQETSGLQTCLLSTIFDKKGNILDKRSPEHELCNKNSQYHTLTHRAKSCKITSHTEFVRSMRKAIKLIESDKSNIRQDDIERQIAVLTYENIESDEIIAEEMTLIMFKNSEILKFKQKIGTYELDINGRNIIMLRVMEHKNTTSNSIYIPKEYRRESENNQICGKEYPEIFVKRKLTDQTSWVLETPEIYLGFLDEEGKYHDSIFYTYSKVVRPNNINEPWECLTDTGEVVLTNSIGFDISTDISVAVI